MSEASFERNLSSAIKRFASGFTKTVALVAPAPATPHQFGGMNSPQFNQLESFLGAELNVVTEDLSDGRVSGQADILLLAAPKNLDEKQLFAVDQFLMQGGTVIAATSPYSASVSNRSLSVQSQTSGLQEWLSHHGLQIENQLVMDTQNVPFPVPVARNVGGFTVQEIRMLDYPYFVDVRGEGLNQDNPITANLPQATLAWASPIIVDQEKQKSRTITELLRSSDNAWLSNSTQVMPRVDGGSLSRFTPEGEQKSRLLGVVSAGRFDSYFAGKASPLLAQADEENAQDGAGDTTTVSGVIERSSESARIILFSSNDFLTDQLLQMAGAAGGGEYLNSLQLLANTVDWSLEDAGLLSIRSRGNFNRTLPTLEHSTQLFWEYLNYGLALLALLIVAGVRYQINRSRQKAYQQLLAH
jgi:ABC-2 type transport system permease protein